MEQVDLNLLVSKLDQVIKQSSPEVLTLGLTVNENELFVYKNRQIKALTRIESADSVLIFKDSTSNQFCAISGTARQSSQTLSSRTILRRQTMPKHTAPGILSFLETFIIRIEKPKVDDIHTLDPHQFWGVKVKDLQIVGGELEFSLTKEGEEDKLLVKGDTIPKDWGLRARVTVATEDKDALVCSLLLEHKSGHKTGWGAIPFNSNETESGSYTIVAALPYPATLLALEGVPSEFTYSVNPAVNSEISGPVVATFTRVQEGDSSFLGSLLIKRQGQERRILERLSFQFTATGEPETEYLIDPYQHKAVRIDGVEGLSVAIDKIQILIKKEGQPDISLDLGEPISITLAKGSQIVARLSDIAADEVVSGRILMRRLG